MYFGDMQKFIQARLEILKMMCVGILLHIGFMLKIFLFFSE